jgi:hypothetical protein
MVAEDFLQGSRVQEWLDGVEPAWTLLHSKIFARCGSSGQSSQYLSGSELTDGEHV